MMIDKLIRTALAVASLGALAACASSPDDSGEELPAAQVQFRASEASRSSLTTNANLKDKAFAVYGDMVSSTAATGTKPTVVFNSTPVSHNGTKWVYENTQYWFPGQTYSFVAQHPAEPAASIVSDLKYENNSLSFTYNYPADYKEAIDVLTAAYRRRYTTGSQTTVPFGFKHILARLNFVAKVDPAVGNSMVIERFAIVNVSRSAKYTITPNGTTDWTADYSDGWSNYTAANEILCDLNNLSIPVEQGESTSLFPADSNPLMIIPQGVATNLEVQITYRRSDSQNSQNATAKLYSTTISAHKGVWKSGQGYTYNFTLGAEDYILFSVPTVDNWRQEEGGNYVITD